MYNPLYGNEIDGNTLNLFINDGISHIDKYKCSLCLSSVDEEMFNHKNKLCEECEMDLIKILIGK